MVPISASKVVAVDISTGTRSSTVGGWRVVPARPLVGRAVVSVVEGAVASVHERSVVLRCVVDVPVVVRVPPGSGVAVGGFDDLRLIVIVSYYRWRFSITCCAWAPLLAFPR